MQLDVQMLMFWLMAPLTGLCAIAAVITQNIVRSATWLLFTLAGTSGIFFLLGADLVGAIQLLVYVGGTMVLVVFGVMLTAQGPFINMKTSGAEWAISMVAGILLFSILCFGLTSDFYATANSRTGESAHAENPDDSRISTTIGLRLLGLGVNHSPVEQPAADDGKGPAEPVAGKVKRLGKDAESRSLRKEPAPVKIHYLLPFEIVSVHLLVVLIGAAYLARAKRRRSEQGENA
jgi:NADH-quinone oxidoreductase subunit J